MSASFEVGLKVDVKGLNTVKDFRSGLGSLADDLSKVRISEEKTRNGITKLTAEISNNLTPAEAKLVRQLIKKAGAQATVTKATKASEVATENLTDAVQDNEKALKDEADALKKAAKETKEKEAADKRAEKAERKLAEETRRHAAALKQLEDKLNAVTKAHFRRAANATRNSFFVQTSVLPSFRLRSHRGGFGPNGGIVGNVGSLPGVGKVVAYDMLRRILTNIYQTVGKVGDEIVEWTKASIQFNDEMARTKTVFRGFGLIGQKNADGSSMSISDAERNPDMGQAMGKINKFADSMMRRMTSLSIMTGQDMEEIIASSRQLTADLINKKTGPGGKSPILDEKIGEELAKTTEDMVGLAAALKAADPGGRSLKWHMVGLQELFSGSSGSGKDKGMSNVYSLMRREGIRIKEKDALPITQAVNKGDIAKASQLIQDVLDRSGQSMITFRNLMANSLMPNIDAIKTSFKKLSAQLHTPLFDFLLEHAKEARDTMLKLMRSDKFAAYIQKFGEKFRNTFMPLVAPVVDFFDKLDKDPEGTLQPYLDTFMNVTKNFNIIFANFITGVVGFFSGLFGVNDKDTFNTEPVIKFSEQFAASGETMGAQMRKMSESILEGLEPLINNFFPAMIALNDVFIVLTSAINPFIRALAQFSYEIMNMPLLGSYMEGQIGKERYSELKNELYQKAYNNGNANDPDMDALGMILNVAASPLKLASFGAGVVLPGDIPILDENGKQKTYPNGVPMTQSRPWTEFLEKTQSNSGNREQARQNRITEQNYNNSEVGKGEAERREKKMREIAIRHGLMKADAAGKFTFTPEHKAMSDRFKSRKPTEKDLAISSEVNKTLAPPVPNNINEKYNVLKAGYDQAVLNQSQKSAIYPTPSGKMPGSLPVGKSFGEKEFITIANKIVAEKFKAINKPFIVKPDKVHNETKITIGSITVTSNDPKKFVDGLKNTGGSSKDNNTPIPYAPDYKARRIPE